MKIFVFVLLLLSLKFQDAVSQNNEALNSPQRNLEPIKEDTSRVIALFEASGQFRFTNSDTAMLLVNQSLQLAQTLNYEYGIANAKVRMGALYADQGKYYDGLRVTNEGLELLLKLVESASVDRKKVIRERIGAAYNVLGHNSISSGNFAEGLRYSFLALKVREEENDIQGMADSEYNIGQIYMEEKAYAEAINHYQSSLKLSREIGNKHDEPGVLASIGWTYYKQGNYTEALRYLSEALDYASILDDEYSLGQIYENLGQVMNQLKEYDKSLDYFFNSIEIMNRIGNRENISILETGIANAYLGQKKYRQAEEYIKKSISTAEEQGVISHMASAYQTWSLLDSTTGDYQSSLQHYKLSVLYRDSLFNADNSRKIAQQQMRYDFDKKEAIAKAEQEKKDAIAQKEMQKQRLVRNGFIGGFVLVMIFAGVFFSQRNKIKRGKRKSDELLLNILPAEVAEELKAKGEADAKLIDEVTVLFTDFKGFTAMSEQLTPKELVRDIHECFSAFDRIMEKYGMEKIKTIGDAYMAAGGLPTPNKTHAVDAVKAAFEILQFIEQGKARKIAAGAPYFEIRIGIHTGPVVAGIVGVKKFAYDIWGDTVNTASRMESSGDVAKVNISETTFALVKNIFKCIPRGKVHAKGKGEIDMYFVERENESTFAGNH